MIIRSLKFVRRLVFLLACQMFLACNGASLFDVFSPEYPPEVNFSNSENPVQTYAFYYPWGYYDLVIARDGSEVSIVPDRSAMGKPQWGYNVNAVKLLEVAPCEDCFAVSNVHLLPNGDVSMDVSITHPFDDPQFTGFDVRGIIMFEGHRQYPDNELRIQAGLEQYSEKETPKLTWSDYELGDAQLMNADGWTTYWSPTEYQFAN